MASPGIYPREQYRPTKSHAEQKVYEVLKRQLPTGWYAWHSLRIRDRNGIDGESDFILAIPNRGFVVMEVKGGSVEQRDGQWFQNGKLMDKTPRSQGNGFAKKLHNRLWDQQCAAPAFGVVTCFPDVAFESGPSQGDMTGLVLGAQAMPYLAEILPDMCEKALPDAKRSRGHWIDTLHRLWGETWTPQVRLGQRLQAADEVRMQLDAEQVELLEGLADNPRMLISGAAGTGKTLLALETARRLAGEGKRVLLLCFTKPLGAWLGRQVGDAGIDVRTIREHAVALTKQAGKDLGTLSDEAAWRDMTLAACDALPALGERWDAVVVDEGQDFSEEGWLLTRESAGDGMLWAFYDPAQAFWEDRGVPEDLEAARYRLRKAYRTPSALQDVAEAYLRSPRPGHECVQAAIDAGALSIIDCPSETSVPDKVRNELDKLLGEGLQPGDIAIISLRGMSAKDSLVHRDKLGRHRLVSADAEDAPDHVVCDTFLRFKGLERPAIIITDLQLVGDHKDVRMHIALTRALLTARVVAPREVLRADSILPPA